MGKKKAAADTAKVKKKDKAKDKAAKVESKLGAKADKALAKLKKKDAPLHRVLAAQSAALTEIRDELRRGRTDGAHTVTLPEGAPKRKKASVSVNER